jgi:hypothetical protein
MPGLFIPVMLLLFLNQRRCYCWVLGWQVWGGRGGDSDSASAFHQFPTVQGPNLLGLFLFQMSLAPIHPKT